jgi:hypothetical protein
MAGTAAGGRLATVRRLSGVERRGMVRLKALIEIAVAPGRERPPSASARQVIFHDLSALHDELDALELGDVGQRIA